jgi:hypothetical protein
MLYEKKTSKRCEQDSKAKAERKRCFPGKIPAITGGQKRRLKNEIITQLTVNCSQASKIMVFL